MKNTTQGNKEDFSMNTRLALGTAGVVMLGYFFATASSPLGATVYLPLLSVFPVLLAVQGGNPFAGLLNSWFSAKPRRSTRSVGKTAAHV